jgi:hypothetical protein
VTIARCRDAAPVRVVMLVLLSSLVAMQHVWSALWKTESGQPKFRADTINGEFIKFSLFFCY